MGQRIWARGYGPEPVGQRWSWGDLVTDQPASGQPASGQRVTGGPVTGVAPTACIACGCELRRPLHTKDGFVYVACRGCGLAHLDPVPTEEGARALFDYGYFTGRMVGGYDDYVADEQLHRRNAASRLGLIERERRGRTGALLDVGCAFGFFLDEARSRGWRVDGVEVSPLVAAEARRRFVLNVVPELADVAVERPGSYDVVSLFQVLEHVSRPDEVLRLARRCLRPGGTAVIETWDRRSLLARATGRYWHEVEPPSVIWLFDRGSLPLLLGRAGLDTVRLAPTAKLVSLRFAGSLLDPPGRRAPLAAVGRLLQRRPLRDRVVSYRLGDLLTAVSTRDPDPVVSEPVVSEPVVSEPVVSEPVVSEPVVSEPAETRGDGRPSARQPFG
jgi:SAM-dependent methyltransferase